VTAFAGYQAIPQGNFWCFARLQLFAEQAS